MNLKFDRIIVHAPDILRTSYTITFS